MRFFAVAIFLMLLAFPVFAAENLTVIEGEITVIDGESIFLNGNKYSIVSERMTLVNPDLIETQCWFGDVNKHQIDFNTIRGVGYVDKALVTLDGEYVHKIEVIELLQ